ncbi:MAG: tRNA lysidine(34) synthetase TilS [Bacteroidetes bacterium MED-G13]|nr:MAG: tRNA lysidine(34) synthetase TilS [Bacteroidetes bacterium MED-G13]
MLSKFQSHIKSNYSFLLKERFILCCSAGVDSVVLLHLFKAMTSDFVVAHCNYNLRKDFSNMDEKFVKDLCEKENLKFYSKSFDTLKIKKKLKKSTQVVARELRYEFFEDLSKKININYILTAHHMNDSMESFFINLSRGSGIDGLIGIPENNGKILRPFINFEKTEILKYAKKNKIKWREDASNQSNIYLRNKIRNELVPLLHSLEGNFSKNFQKSLRYLKLSNLLIYDKIEELMKEYISYYKNDILIDIKKLNSSAHKEAFLYFLLRDYGFNDWDKILLLDQGERGKKICSNTHILFKSTEKLVLRKNIKNNVVDAILDKYSKEIKLGHSLKISFCIAEKISKNKANLISVDFNKLSFPLKLRNIKNGDYFFPIGMVGKKKVVKYLKDKKINSVEKFDKLVLVNGDDKIIWVVGMGLDRRFSVSDSSKKIIDIKIDND